MATHAGAGTSSRKSTNYRHDQTLEMPKAEQLYEQAEKPCEMLGQNLMRDAKGSRLSRSTGEVRYLLTRTSRGPPHSDRES